MEEVKNEIRSLACINNNKYIVRYYDTWIEKLTEEDYEWVNKQKTEKDKELSEEDDTNYFSEEEIEFDEVSCLDPNEIEWEDSPYSNDSEEYLSQNEEDNDNDNDNEEEYEYEYIEESETIENKEEEEENETIENKEEEEENVNLTIVENKIQDNQSEKYVICIQMEYCTGGDLSKIIKNKELHYSSQEGKNKVMNYFKQIVMGVSTIHQHCIIHGDLKPGNILKEKDTMKIGDFGLARTNTDYKSRIVGTIGYAAPEIVTGNYDNKIDIYSLGIILYEMCLSPTTRSEFIYNLDKLKNQRKINEIVEKQYQMYKDLILEMTEINPKDRPTIDEIIKKLTILDEDLKKISEILPFIQEKSNLWPQLSEAIENKMKEKIKDIEKEKIEEIELTTTHLELIRSLTEIHILYGTKTIFINPFIPTNLLKESGIEYHEIQSPILINKEGELMVIINNYQELVKIIIKEIKEPITSYIIRIPTVNLHITKEPTVSPSLVYINTSISNEQHQFNIIECITLIESIINIFMNKNKLHISHSGINEIIHNNKEIEEIMIKKPIQSLTSINKIIQKYRNEKFNYIIPIFNYLKENEEIVYDLGILGNNIQGLYFEVKNEEGKISLTGGETRIKKDKIEIKTIGYWIKIDIIYQNLGDKKTLITKRKVLIKGITDKMSKASIKIYLEYFGFNVIFKENIIDYKGCWIKLNIHKDEKYDFFTNSFWDIGVTINIYIDKDLIRKEILPLGKAIRSMQKNYTKKTTPILIADEKLVSNEIWEWILLPKEKFQKRKKTIISQNGLSFIRELEEFKKNLKSKCKFILKRGNDKKTITQ
ncbi:interferon-induced, double-stranded RNA-activated protein kinase, putative [Entamoeba dispar SAW760]|uniref:Interferon-induced, double-stranded RNA-activated protein kinase, putative n=1 Tax=Entamoeba dispar (strain ATCC PRA-260 / SAW760) TaxID=370354 RepID=B0E8Q7_ENTDS|nr:interferon-induced, double-stranded RNA-activated protein kinase, putative [Entamoeba dispar SAW760]EDR29093.1 interferon-induced, double-stranded RNA-activated protein kinase, putative [Entamoeba dispar SAW760]|eukprot:EDR29093.1 interferon-induced, double-stranded RNA-activated protein kinase, putative [Entamoeba dispar SAW760]